MSTWVLMRGLTRESGHWGAFLASFQARFPHDRLVLQDLPGNGSLHQDTSPARVEALAALVRADLQRRGIRTPVRVLAMSLGAMVATAWAAAAPHEIEAAVLVNTSMKPWGRTTERLRTRQWGRLLRLALGRPAPATWEQTVYDMTCNTRPCPPRVMADWVQLHRERPVGRGNAARQLLAAARYRAPDACPLPPAATGTAPPMLLLASAQDGLVDPVCSQRMAAAWGLPLQLHPTAGHDLPFDDGRWVAEQVRQWVQQLPTPP